MRAPILRPLPHILHLPLAVVVRLFRSVGDVHLIHFGVAGEVLDGVGEEEGVGREEGGVGGGVDEVVVPDCEDEA